MIYLFDDQLKTEAATDKVAVALGTLASVNDEANIKLLAEIVSKFIQEMPKALVVVSQMANDKNYGKAVSFAYGQVLVYLLDENDLFPESEFGVVGLIDDAYLVHSLAQGLMRRFTYHRQPEGGYKPPSAPTLETMRYLLPEGVSASLDWTCQNLLQVAATLFVGNNQSSPVGDIGKVKLRIENALQKLTPAS